MAEVAANPSKTDRLNDGDIAETQETDVFRPASNPNLLIDYEVKHRIARALRHIAVHFDSFSATKSNIIKVAPPAPPSPVTPVMEGGELAKKVNAMLNKDEIYEAHQVLCDAIDNIANDAFSKVHVDVFAQYFNIMTNKKTEAAFIQTLRDNTISARSSNANSLMVRCSLFSSFLIYINSLL